MPSFRLPPKTSLFIIFIIIAISLFTLYPSFNLALFGDDWLAFIRYLYHLGPNPGVDGKWDHLTYFLTPYGSQDILMGLLYKIYGYQSTFYYLTSYFLRMIAAFSFIPVTFYMTKSKLATLFAVLFFAVSTTGIETTNWVFNMPSYIAIAFFNLFLYFFIKAREPKNLKLLAPAAILYYLAYVTTPIRMHGILPFVVLIELFWIVQNRNFKTIKIAFLRVLIIILVFIFISKTGHSNGAASDWSQRFQEGISQFTTMVQEGKFDLFFYPLIIFGGAIIPSFLINSNSLVTGRLDFIFLTISSVTVFTILLILIAKNTYGFKPKQLIRFLLIASFWTIVVFFIFLNHKLSFTNTTLIILLFVGGYTFITALILFWEFKRNLFFTGGLFIAFTWTIMSFFAPWWWNPSQFIFSTHRYMIPATTGISLLFALFISAGTNLKSKKILFVIFSLLLIIHSLSTRFFLSQQLEAHSQKISDKIWNSFSYYPEIGTDKNFRLFYFEGDIYVQGIIHDVITFGFPPHLGLIYKYYIHHGTGNNVATNNFDDLVSAVTDGIYLTIHGRTPAKPIEIEYIYAFKVIRTDDNVSMIDITNEVREKLKKIVSIPAP